MWSSNWSLFDLVGNLHRHWPDENGRARCGAKGNFRTLRPSDGLYNIDICSKCLLLYRRATEAEARAYERLEARRRRLPLTATIQRLKRRNRG